MDISFKIILAASIAMTVWIVRYLYRRKKKSEEELISIKALHTVYQDYLTANEPQINYATRHVLPFENKYCSWTYLQEKFLLIRAQIDIVTVPKGYNEDNELNNHYKKILHFLENGDNIRKAHNNSFIKDETARCHDFFNTVLSNPLDKQQIDAILHDDDNILVVAGAGCGKTTTVQGKVNYLLHCRLAKPKEILLLSFAKKSADDLKEKVGYLGVECRTFHSLAYQIIKSVGRPADVIAPEEAQQLIVYAHGQLIKDPIYLESFNDFLLTDLRPIKHENEFKTYKEYIDYLKDSEFESLKGMLAKKKFHRNDSRKTLSNEFVKSGEECYIANFLFLHGVEYSYEAPYLYQHEIDADEQYDKHKKRYRPDFTIYLNGYDEQRIKSCPNPEDNVIYLEHYGIDEKGNTPQFFDDKDNMSSSEHYNSIIRWKDDVHRRYKTKLIKSYSYEFKNKNIEENLIVNLLNNGVQIVPKSNDEIYKVLQEAYSKEIDAAISLIQTFIGLLKSNGRQFDELLASNRKQFIDDPRLVLRNERLLDIIQKIYDRYQSELESKQQVDFNDLINQAKKVIESNAYHHTYKYIIVDEFQDISINRYELLNALKRQSYCKLFAVGDDWQSIYRFSGSDLTLFKRFEEYFGHTITKKIETTYRFAEPLISISSNFILKNPNQAKKKLKAGRNIQTDVMFEFEKKEEQSVNQNVLDILQKLYLEYGSDLAQKSITLLGRYNHDIDKLASDKNFLILKDEAYIQLKAVLKDVETDDEGRVIRNNQLSLNKTINFMTVHKAKGLESDIVILINCETGKYGFPAELSDDKILDLLLSGDDQFPNGEERRAFYVAMTRAKEKFYFMANKYRLSKFVREIYGEHVAQQAEMLCCQKCEAELRFIKDISNKFGLSKMFGCTNYKYGCNYTVFINESELNSVMALNRS